MSYDLSEEFLSFGLGPGSAPRVRPRDESEGYDDRPNTRARTEAIKRKIVETSSAIVWGFEGEETTPLTEDQFKTRASGLTPVERKKKVRLTKTGSKFFAFLLARCQKFLARSPLIWERSDEEERDTSDVTVPWQLFSTNLKQEANSYDENYSASGDFIFWQALRAAFSRAVAEDAHFSVEENFQYRTVGGQRGLLSEYGVREFVDWLADSGRVREDTATLAKFVVNFRDTISESASEKQRIDLERTNAYADDMRWFMREEEMVDVLKDLPEPDDVPDRMLYPFDVMTRENPLPPHLWERVRDMPGGYVDDFKEMTCEEQKKICDDVAKQPVIANAFSCAREPLKSLHENTCGRNFLYHSANRRAALHGMTGEIRMMFTRNVTVLNLDEVELVETDDPLFELNLPKLRTLRVYGEPSSPQRQIGRFDINIHAMRKNMPNLESLVVRGIKIDSDGRFVHDEYSWPPKLRAVELIRTGLERIELRSDVLRTVDISGNKLKRPFEHPLVLGKNIETLKLRNMGLHDVPPAVFGLAALKHLDVSENNLTTIPSDIGNLVELEHLNLVGNDVKRILDTIPDTFASLNNLKTLELGQYVNSTNESGQSPLLIAANEGREIVVKALLKAGAAVNQANKKGWTPLMVAAQNGHEGVVKALLKAGANVNQANGRGGTPLIAVAFKGHEAIARALLEAGADVNKADKKGWTPLTLAAHYGHEVVVRALLAAGANVNPMVFGDKATPLTIAAQNGHEGVVNALLAAGANVNLMTENSGTALVISTQEGHEAVVRALLVAGADVNKSVGKDDWTPLVFAAHYGHEGVVRALLEGGADVNKANKQGITPLIVAAENGHEAVVRVLLEWGVDVNNADAIGATALSLAAENGHEGVVSALLDAKADVNKAENDGSTPLIFASRSGHETIVKMLLDAGADARQASNDGTNPFFAATNESVARALEERGAVRRSRRLHEKNAE